MVLIYLALLARILMAGYEKLVVKKLGHQSDSLSATFLFFSLATLFLLPCIFFVPFPQDFSFLRYALLSSFIYSIADLFYLKSLSEGEVSLVGPLYNINVFFVLVLTVLFLGEAFSLVKVLGILLLFYGASFLNKQKNILFSLKALFQDPACRWMIACSLMTAMGRTIDGFSVQKIHPIHYAFCLYVFISLFLFSYIFFTRKLKTTWRLLKQKTSAAVQSGGLNSLSYLCALYTFTKLEVSVAEPISMLSVVVTVILAHFMFREKIKSRLLAAVIMILGAWLLFL
ncbi:MAG: EamA family transporter [Deltaproteobacteria bacterium]|nr:EamA family transporter [Deltaproteobacteria bacterium]MBI3016632.1 EamA family transporter [Deltaproteobacteria bacterium]